MDNLVESLALVEEVNQLIEHLQESLELFKRGEADSALGKINSVEDGIEDLSTEEMPEPVEVDEKLSLALNDLKWISENADRVLREEENEE